MRELYLDNGNEQFKFADTTTQIRLNAFDDGYLASLTENAKVRIKNDSGYLLEVGASVTKNQAVITSGQLAQLPAGNYLIELWDTTANGGTAIYPSDGFLRLQINDNATGFSGGLVSSITVNDFIKQFGDLSQQLKKEISKAVINAQHVPEVFANSTDLKNVYPKGKDGLFVTADTGHKWLFVNGNWQDAGVYQIMDGVDKTLSVDGVPADAKAVGDRVGFLENTLLIKTFNVEGPIYYDYPIEIKKGVRYKFVFERNTNIQGLFVVDSNGVEKKILEHPLTEAVWVADDDYSFIRAGSGVTPGIKLAVKSYQLDESLGEFNKDTVEKILSLVGKKYYNVKNISVGKGKDYEKLEDALDSISNNSKKNRYVINVYEGTYSVPTDRPYFGLKNYVDIIGQNKEKCIITNLASSTVYDANKSGFDPAYYQEAIEYAKIANLTIKTQGCKCPVHIDTDYSHLAKGGEIHIDNCILNDLNPESFLSTTETKGGVNVGLRGGQSVYVSNTVANGAIYAHTSSIDQTGEPGAVFNVDNCTFPYWAGADLLDNTNADSFTLTNCNVKYGQVEVYALGSEKGIFSIKPNFSGTNIGMLVFPDRRDAGNPYAVLDRYFDGKFVFPIVGRNELVYVDGQIARGDLISFSGSYEKDNSKYAKPKSSKRMYPTVEASHDGMVMIQKKGIALLDLSAITDIEAGDYIGYVNGKMSVVDTSNLCYMGQSTLWGGYSLVEILY